MKGCARHGRCDRALRRRSAAHLGLRDQMHSCMQVSEDASQGAAQSLRPTRVSAVCWWWCLHLPFLPTVAHGEVVSESFIWL